MKSATGANSDARERNGVSHKGECVVAENGKQTKDYLDEDNTALFTTHDHRLYIGQSILPEKLEHDQALVRMKVNGICGSDIHFWKAGEIGEVHVDGDYVLGHEGAGIVVEVGRGVTTLKPGDRVAIEPGVPCEHCTLCGEGNYNLCGDVAFTGAYPYNGSIRKYHIHPAKFLHKLPGGMTYSEGALLEPLSVVMHAFQKVPVSLGHPAVVFGAGPIGLIALACAKASGASPLLIADINASRLEFAKALVPGTRIVQIGTDVIPEQNAARVAQSLKSDGVDLPKVIYECTGVESSVATAAFSCRRAGSIMVIGVGRQKMNNLPFMHMSMGEIDLKFINRYHHTWPAAIRLMQSKTVNLNSLVTHTFPLSKAVEAMEFVTNPRNGGIKIHILDDSDWLKSGPL